MSDYSIHIETLGCRLNHDESEGAAHLFMEAGFSVDMDILTASCPAMPNAVLGIINTCTVTGKAEQKARRVIRLMLSKLPNALIIVTGCYAALDSSEITAISPERISIVPGTQKYLLSLIAKALTDTGALAVSAGRFSHEALDSFIAAHSGKSLLAKSAKFVKSVPVKPFTLYTSVFSKHSRASLKIQDGCNCECSYCRIQLSRGKSVSLSVAECVERVQELEAKGINEVILTGVNLSQYAGEGSDAQRVDFAGLLDILIKKTSRIFFRVSSFYPESINEKLCTVLASPRVQPFFHLSIQSGSDVILKAMKRPHSVENVFRSIENIRKVKENPFISCDIIAGFPGESEADFAKTKELCEKSNFAWIHAFPFSSRPGTLAASMEGKIPERIKGERVQWLTQKAIEGKLQYIEQWKGRELDAVVENSRSQQKNCVHAVTGNYLHVECPADDAEHYKPGSLIRLVIQDSLESSIRSGREIECTGVIV